MNDRLTEQDASDNQVWQWISTDEFRLPSASIQTTFKTRVLSLVNRYRNTPPESGDAILSREKLESLSRSVLERIVPSMDLKTHAQSLDPVLIPWCEASGKRFAVILNVPHSGNSEILKHWAIEHDFRIIEPPKPSDLLKSDDTWFEQFKSDNACWVFPGLERSYLRHQDGLAHIRRFFDLLAAGRLGVGVVGCSSWAWSFFRHALGVNAPFLKVAKPFDSEKLAQWLGAPVFGKSRRQILFRQSDNGRLILSSASKGKAADEKNQAQAKAQDPFLRDLAAFSYGIPGVALAYWRSSLQGEPDTLDLEKKTEETTSGHSTIWVKPWINIEKPGMPEKVERHHAFILHSLLLHDTLDMDMLSKLLPMPRHHFGQTLYSLSDNGLIECLENQWRISPKGYPVVRGFLKNEGFLTDDFS